MRGIIVAVALLGVACANVSYDGYKVYKVSAKSEADNQYLLGLKDTEDFDFWSKINKVGDAVSVMVAPKAQEEFEATLARQKIEYSIEIENVENSFETERAYHKLMEPLKSGRVAFDQYLTHAQINAYVDEVATRFPNLVRIENFGKSYENRDIRALRISTDFNQGTVRHRKIFVDAGIHAREWIAPAMAVYLIFQLVENYSVNSALLRDIDWIIVPLLNPDGYEYSRTVNRLWRKTTSPGVLCNGCDGNRNFGFHWMEAGASQSECSEIYAGKQAFSEVETRNLRDYLLAEEGVDAYLTLHSYGNYFLYPWGYGPVLPDNWQELDNLGQKAAEAIRAVAGTRYTVGSSTLVLYEAAGASDDWSMGVAGIPIVYTIELPGGGVYGFDLPASRILAVAQETFEGFKVIAEYIRG